MNPWGSVEWKGHWSDHSMDWNLVDSSERRKLGIEFSEDGEFWMSYKEWLANFTRVQICHLGPDSLTMEDSAKFSWKSWNATIEHSAWVRRVNAGGCRNYAS
ncbi:calpain-2 catalytic subunit-like [Octopus sinensis]|uniref:Calpain-2 catalytic subunit-like n=1 Tax=Octopus sinensis TaxID=2607531 RepID=A0A6P7TQP1_9MOLL|nr:calpain-2 catalytic subunit-like [Octopus sinensis]